jgi:hypothetical protein
MGEQIRAQLHGANLEDTVVRVSAPDTVVISQPHVQLIGPGSFNETILWTVEHVQSGTSALVEIMGEAGNIRQIGLCKVIG